MSTASIFISHTSSDNGFCRRLFSFLKQRLADMEHVLEQTMQVHQAFEAKQWRTVVRLGHHVVKLPGNGRDATLWGELGIALVHVGESVEGMHALDKALGINRYRSDLWRATAQALIESNDL